MGNLSSKNEDLYICKQIQWTDKEVDSSSIDWNSCNAVELTDTVTGLPSKEHTELRACWSPDGLYVRFLCKDTNVVSDFEQRDDPLYEQDVVEIFIDEEGTGIHYLELEVSPKNIVFDAQIQNNGIDAIAATDLAWSFQNLQTSVEMNEDETMSVFIFIPAINFKGPLERGVRWRVNFYRIDEDLDGIREFQAWRPTGAVNYHIPSKFGTLLFD